MTLREPVNYQSIFSNNVPTVFIDCITLESSSIVEERSDPHIDHPQERGARIGESNSLKTELNLIIKESLADDLISNWFDEIDFSKYLVITVGQSTNPESTAYLLKNHKKISDPNFMRRLSTMMTIRKINILHERNRHEEAEGDRITNSIAPRSLNSKLNQYYSYVDFDGNKIHDISYRTTFQHVSSNPKHLAFFAFTTLDVDSLANEFNLNLSNENLRGVVGRFTSEIVIDNFKTVSQSRVFKTRTGEIWAGKVHKRPDGTYMTRQHNNANSQMLKEEFVPNYKVQDFRDLSNVDKLSIDFSDIENRILPEVNSNKIVNNQAIDLDRISGTAFTECFLSRDPDGTCRFLFGLDFEKMVKSNSLFKSFFYNTTQTSLQSIISMSNIREIKFIRRRVRDNGYGIEPFDINAPQEVLAVTGESEGLPIRAVSGRRGSFQEINVFHNESNKMRYFSGVDREMPEITDGIYQYGVELHLEDGTAKYLKLLMQKLVESSRFLKRYLDLAMIPGNFDSDSNKFTQRFSRTLRNTFSEEKPWQVSIVNYIEILNIISVSPFNASTLTNKLYNVISPVSGGPRGIDFFIKLYDKLIMQFEIALSHHNVFPSHSNQGLNSENVHRKSGIPKSTKIEKYFDQTFDSNVPKFTGYDFLSTSGISGLEEGKTLKVINGSEFIKRAEMEKFKYFTDAVQDVSFEEPGFPTFSDYSLDDNLLSYLSPSTVNIAGLAPLKLLRENGGLNKNIDRYQEMMFQTVRMNSEFREPPSFGIPIPSAQNIRRNRFSSSALGRIISGDGVTFVSPSRSVRALPPGEVEELVSEKVFGDNKIGTDKFRITKSKTFCDDADNNENLDVNSVAEKLLELSFLNDVSRRSLDNASRRIFNDATGRSIRPYTNPLKRESWDLKSEINLFLRSTSTRESAMLKPIRKEELVSVGTAPDSLVSAVTETRDRYSNQGLNADCFELAAPDVGLGGLKAAPVDETIGAGGQVTRPDMLREDPAAGARADDLDLAKAPIQAFSVFIGSLRPSIVNDNIHTPEADPLQGVGNFLYFWMNYSNLMKIEVLTGYRKSWIGGVQIKSPIFRKMDYDLYRSSIGKSLLCRMIPYNNPSLGIVSPITSCDAGEGCTSLVAGEQDLVQKMSLPVFHKYFIVVPENEGLGRLSLGTAGDNINVPVTPEDAQIANLPVSGINLASPMRKQVQDLENKAGVSRELTSTIPEGYEVP